MKFEIKHRFSGAVLFTCELPAEIAEQSQGRQLGFAITKAVEARANLAGANLAGAYLARADLGRANLTRANLARANLAGANLARANLAGAYLGGANLTRANLAGANFTRAKNWPIASEEEVARLDQVREIVLAKPERLYMGSWHSQNWNPSHTPEEEHACGSQHCIAGWLQALSPDPKIREMSAEHAGYKLAPASSYMFYTTDAMALQWLKDRGYAAQQAESK